MLSEGLRASCGEHLSSVCPSALPNLQAPRAPLTPEHAPPAGHTGSVAFVCRPIPFVSLRAHTHTRTHTQMRACTHTQSHRSTHTHTHKHTHTGTHTHAHTKAHTHVHTHTHSLSLTHTHTHTDACAHTQSHRCTHTHTRTHTHARTPQCVFCLLCVLIDKCLAKRALCVYGNLPRISALSVITPDQLIDHSLAQRMAHPV